jgi:transcriptional regulator with XRE-family HTH domain
MVNNLVENEHTREDIQDELQAQSLASVLFSMRCQHGLTQQQLADKMGVTQSQISKLEHAKPEQITIQDLNDYSAALGIDVVIRFQKSMTAVGKPSFKIEGPEDSTDEKDFKESLKEHAQGR